MFVTRSEGAAAVVAALTAMAAAQVDEPPPPAPAPVAPDCYSAGSVAGAVVGTFLVTLVLVVIAALVYKFYWRGRRGKHLILTKDPEGGSDQYAFDNPCFRDGTPLSRAPPEKDPNRIDNKAKWTGWPSLAALAGGKTGDKRRALDDSCLPAGDAPAQPRLVTLRSRDFTGLGFNVCGNMRDGIFVRDVQHRGPAFESGRIQPGDRIDAVRISFRHMVFEDALTILSYASPYEVQLELDSAAPAPGAAAAAAAAAAGSLLRPRRSGAALAAGAAAAAAAVSERIVHPFFRSQSSADLAQINKASVRRMQQLSGTGGNGKGPQSQMMDEQGNNEYPTLKLSSSPTLPVKETTRLEKTAPTAVVKPERVKRASTPKEPDASLPGETGTLNKFQKFGVRVLPDPAPRQTTEGKSVVEAEKHQNEQNSIKERVKTNPFSEAKGHDTVDSGDPSDMSVHYDERAIDVGPVELQHISSHDQKIQQHHQRNISNDEEDVHKENNVKHLLTKGLQNLKEKLHHDKKSADSPESPQRYKDKKQKPARHHKTSMSSDSEGIDGERSLEGTLKPKIIPRDEPEKIERKRQRNPEKDGPADFVILPPGSGIPSELPEEVHRAAVAARSNRKSLQTCTPVVMAHENKDTNDLPQSATATRESVSDSSSDEGGNDINTDSSGRTPKRSNKRKAPLPPAEDTEQNFTSIKVNANKFESDQNKLVSKQNMAEKDINEDFSVLDKTLENGENKLTGENETITTTFASLAQQKNNPELSGKDITNITIDNGNSNAVFSLTSRTAKSVENDSAGQANSFPVDSSSSGTSTMETKTMDYDDGIHPSTVNSDSDSDLERMEGEEEEYDRRKKRSKKGGTTIELNSSHITIHHSPSSETMQMTTELESDSTRKAASLGDLSRLDSEQPMSILERAVSLDLGDGGTPHSNKKRKAPLPPPGEEYLSAIQDTDDGAHYRKEPRLDNAMDTFQRRRLKKSSDWGTLEEALKQTDNSLIPSKASNVEIKTTELDLSKHKENLGASHDGIQTEIANLADDQKVKLSGLSQKFADALKAEAINEPSTEPLNLNIANQMDRSDFTEQSGRSSPECDHSILEQDNMEAGTSTVTENTKQKKTVLHISPEPTKKSSEVNTSTEGTTTILPSHVTIASPLHGLRRAVSEPVGHEVTLSTTPELNYPPISPRLRSSNIVSSTPLPNHERVHTAHFTAGNHNSSTEPSYIQDSLQSPLVTSSDAGISNINVVSSTTHDTTTSSELDPSLVVSSATDHFVTAASFIDSTSAPEEISDNEDVWGNDLQPPELPTSPVPVLSQGSSSTFAASPSMTYITEIQVVTTTDSDNDQTIGSTNMEITHNGGPITSSFLQKDIKSKSDAHLSADSIGTDIIDDEVNAFQTADSNSPGHAPRSSVTVTSIRTSSESASGQSGGTLTETTTNHLCEKKPKPARPPVPPRKSDLSSPPSSPPSMSSSTIMVEVPKIRLTETTSSSLLAGGSVSQVSPAAAGKFISFSSLSPRAEGNSTRHGSSFEQWVFLDDASPSGHHNGFETSVTPSENVQHASVMTLPGLATNRSQTVTHIILDTKQNSGGQVQE